MKKNKIKGEALNKLYREAETELKKIPGVVGVGFGYKEKKGRLTKELSLRVYVKKKKADNKVSDKEKIPAEYKGIKTDVLNTFNDKPASCADTTHYDEILGGITITTDDIFFDNGGTLGCLVSLDNEDSRDNIGILSNKHVLDAGLNDRVFHPFFNNPSSIDTLRTENEGVIAKMYNVGTKSNVNFHYPGDSDPTEHPYHIDCATAKVTTSHSSCCPTNCGTKYKPEIKDIGGIRGIRRLQPSDLTDGTPFVVKKIGRRTGLTRGHVVDVNVTYPATGDQKHGTILIAPFEDNCEGLRKFADQGDSGSMILTEQNEVVGLLYSIPDVPSDNDFFGHGIASHIHPVLDFLSCTIITSSESSDSDRRQKAKTDSAHNDQLKKLKQDFISQGPEYKKMYWVLEKNRAEAVRLVNHKRPVTVVWHRNHGPAFVAHFIKNFRNPNHKVPLSIKGTTLPHLLKVMRHVIYEYSSLELKKAIDQYGDQLISCADECSGVHNLLANISKSKQQAPIYHGRNH